MLINFINVFFKTYIGHHFHRTDLLDLLSYKKVVNVFCDLMAAS